MLNYCVLVGHVSEVTSESVTLTIPRVNSDQIDHLKVIVSPHMLETMKEYATVGRTMGIKAAVHEDAGVLFITAEKITFLNK